MERGVSYIKKRLCIILALLLLAVPGVSAANAPLPDPTQHNITVSNAGEGSSVTVFLENETGTFEQVCSAVLKGIKKEVISFHTRADVNSRIYIEIETPEGERLVSNELICEQGTNFNYDVKSNRLTENHGSTSFAEGLAALLIFLVYTFLTSFLVPLAVTLLTEFLVSLPFRLVPKKHVILTNLITNPVMNILLGMFELIVAPAHAWQHLLTVCVLEAVVIWIEYSIYLKRYKDRTKGILFLFTLLANAASWGLIELIRIWI